MRQAAALGRRIEKSRHFSESAFSVAKVAKRQKNQLTFLCNRQQTRQNIQNIGNNRSFGKRKTYLFRIIFLFRNIPNERALSQNPHLLQLMRYWPRVNTVLYTHSDRIKILDPKTLRRTI